MFFSTSVFLRLQLGQQVTPNEKYQKTQNWKFFGSLPWNIDSVMTSLCSSWYIINNWQFNSRPYYPAIQARWQLSFYHLYRSPPSPILIQKWTSHRTDKALDSRLTSQTLPHSSFLDTVATPIFCLPSADCNLLWPMWMWVFIFSYYTTENVSFLSCDMHAYVAYLLRVGSAWHDYTDNIMIHATCASRATVRGPICM